MADDKLRQEELLKIDYKPAARDWADPSVTFKKGTYSHGAPLKHQKYLGLPNQREWQPTDADWKLPQNWKEIILEGMEKLLKRHRSFRLYLDICVRCGACADKCHYFIGSGDPRNMPVLRAELL
ncbi:MAG: (Fe-S)-binding protein, partial [Syntrophorhabdales bacterium]